MSRDLNYRNLNLYGTFIADIYFGFFLENNRGRPKNDAPLSYQDLIETLIALLSSNQ